METSRRLSDCGAAGWTRAAKSRWTTRLLVLLAVVNIFKSANKIPDSIETQGNSTVVPVGTNIAPGQSNQSSPPSTPLTCDVCSPAVTCHGNMPPLSATSVQGNVLRQSGTFYSGNRKRRQWGNALSPYWAARTMAHLGGYEYQGDEFGEGTWMQHLPTRALARPAQNFSFQATCRNCTGYFYFHEGGCSAGYGRMSEIIMSDTRDAIVQFSKRAPKEENDAIFDFFRADDWLISNRCSVMHHELHAPAVLKIYESIPEEGAFNVYIMMGRREDPFGLCDELISHSVDYIERRNPYTTVTILQSSSKYVDFSRLVFAPNVLIAATGSSWVLWSAVFANNGTVVSTLPMWGWDTEAPPSVTILADVPSLRSPLYFEDAAKDYGIPFGKFSNSPHDRAAVIRFFLGNTTM